MNDPWKKKNNPRPQGFDQPNETWWFRQPEKQLGGRYFPGIKLPQPQTWNRIPLKRVHCLGWYSITDPLLPPHGSLPTVYRRLPLFAKGQAWRQLCKMPVNGKVECLSWLLGSRKITDFRKTDILKPKVEVWFRCFSFSNGWCSWNPWNQCRARYWKMQVETVESMKVRIGPFTKFNRLLVRSYGERTQLCQIMPRKKGPGRRRITNEILVV